MGGGGGARCWTWFGYQVSCLKGLENVWFERDSIVALIFVPVMYFLLCTDECCHWEALANQSTSSKYVSFPFHSALPIRLCSIKELSSRHFNLFVGKMLLLLPCSIKFRADFFRTVLVLNLIALPSNTGTLLQVLCFYFVFTVFVTVGFGDITAGNSSERVKLPLNSRRFWGLFLQIHSTSLEFTDIFY